MAPKLVRRLRKGKASKQGMTTSDSDLILTKEQILTLKSEHDRLVTEIDQRDQQIVTITENTALLESQIHAFNVSGQALTEQLNASKNKLFEALNQNTQLKQELKMAQKYVELETGESMKSVSSVNKTWRGRAQQICILQSRLAELKGTDGGASGDSEKDSKIVQLRKAESQRRLDTEKLANKLAGVQQECEDQRTKLSAQRLRNRNLQDEIAALKAKLSEANEKSVQDDNNIKLLNEKVDSQHNHNEEKLQQLQYQADSKQQEIERLSEMLKASQQSLRDSNAEVALQRCQVAELQTKNEIMVIDLQSACGEFLFNCRDLRKDEYMAILDALQLEKESLLGQVQALNHRLVEERSKADSLSEQIRKLNIKHNRLEFKYNESLKEQNSIKERNRRAQRIATYVRASTASTDGVNPQATLPPVKKDSDSNFQMNFEIADLRNKLDFANERIALLDENVADLTAEKTKDVQLFSSIIARSKFVLRDYLRARRSRELGRSGCVVDDVVDVASCPEK